MRVQELMTTPALSIGPGGVKEVARIFVEKGITGLPVCDARHHVVGVVSAGDVLYKEHDPLDKGRRRRPRWPRGRGAAAIKSKALIVREAMTSPPVTISPWSSASEAARLMTEHGVNRLPVVKGDALVGIVTRSDLVRAFIRSDEEIERELREEVLEQTMWLDRDSVQVDEARPRQPRRHTPDSEQRHPARGVDRPHPRGRDREVRAAVEPRRPEPDRAARGRAIGSMTSRGSDLADAFDVEAVRRRLEEGNGGYEIVRSLGLEVGVYVLVAPEPDHQQPHEDDELYVVLDGRGTLTVEGKEIPLTTGNAVFVPAGAEHQFTGYEGLSVLVVFARQPGDAAPRPAPKMSSSPQELRLPAEAHRASPAASCPHGGARESSWSATTEPSRDGGRSQPLPI